MTQDYRLFHDGAEIDESTASALMIDASLLRGVDIRELRATYALALDFSDHDSLDSMMARESLFGSAEIEVIPADSDSLALAPNLAPVPITVTDRERFGAMGWQSMANLILRESAPDSDRLKAWEYLNASALEIGKYWSGLSNHARSRILGAMALDLSALGFVTGES